MISQHLRRVRFSRRIFWVAMVSAPLFLIAEILVRGFVFRPIGSLSERFMPGTVEVVTHLFATALIIGLGFYARWLVTRHRRMQGTLQERMAQVESFVSAFPNLAVSLSRDHKILGVNSQMERFFGRERDKVLGEDFLEFFLPQSVREPFAAHVHQVLTGETAGSLETIIPGRDGTGRLISWDFNRLTGPDGAPAGVIASGRDISEERSASDVLRTAGQRHRELFENMTSGVAVLEAIHGGNNFIFRELNSAAEEMDRITRPRVIERCVTEIFPDVKIRGLFAVLQRVWRTEQPEYLLAANRHGKDGRPGWREHYVYRLPSGEIAIVYNDVAERKQTEENLQRIAWLLNADLQPDGEQPLPPVASYGDPAEFNELRVIRGAVAKDVLQQIGADHLQLLNTSVAVYEVNGDYALGPFCSGWCRFLGEASRELCGTDDNREALTCGKWLCHESCWGGASRMAISTGQPVDVPCTGGLRLYAVPISAGDEIIGSLSLGHGDPPRDPASLQRIAARYHVDAEELLRLAEAYESRPPFLVEIAKRRLIASAQLIGEIVHRKRKEDALRESEHRSHDVSLSMADWIWEVDAHGVYTHCSDRVKDVLGYEPKKIIGKTPFELMSSEEGRKASIAFNRIAQRKAPIKDLENWKIRKDGRRVCVLTNGVPLLDEQGRLQGYRGVDRDISQRKQAEEALRRHEEEYRLVVDNVGEGIIIIQDEALRFVNDPLLVTWGYSREELLSRPFTMFIHPDDRERVAQHHVQVMAGEETPDSCEHRIIAKDGSIHWIENTSVQTTWEGKSATLDFLVDVTEKKLIEDTLQANEEKHRRVIENLPGVVYSALPDEQFRRIFLAGCAEELTGYSEQQFLDDAELFTRILYPNDRDYVSQEVGGYRADMGILDIEYRIVTRKGQVKWIHDTARPMRDEQGRLVQINGVMQDVTQRRGIQESLAEREHELRMITGNVPVSAAYVDADERHHFANDAYCEAFKLSRKQIVGKQLAETLGGDAYAAATPRIREVLDGKRVNYKISLTPEADKPCRLDITYVPDQRGDEVRGFFIFASDITARDLMEGSLHEREVQLRSILDAVPDGVITLDKDLTVMQHNATMAKLAGRSFVGEKCYAAIWNRQEPCEGCPSLEVLRDGTAHSRDVEPNLAHHNAPAMHLSSHPIKGQEGDVIGVVEYVRDTAERVRAAGELQETELKLRDTEGKYRLLAEHQTDLVIKLDGQYRFVFVSPSYCGLFGKSEEELLGKEFLSLVHEDDRAVAGKALEDLHQAPHSCHIELRASIKDDWRWLSWTSKAILGPQGEIAEIVAVGRDITSRKTAATTLLETRAALGESDAKIRSLSEHSRDIVIHADRDGRILFINQPILGLGVEDVVGRSVVDFASKKQRGLCRKGLEHVAATGEGTSLKVTAQGPDGSEAQLEMQLDPITREGQVVSLVIIATDVTQRRGAEEERDHLQDQLREVQRLEQQAKQRLEDQLQETRKLEQEIKQRLETEQRLEHQLQEAQGLEQETKQRLEDQLQEAGKLEQEVKQRLEAEQRFEDQLREAQKLEQEVKQHLEVEQRLEDQLQQAGKLEQEVKQHLEVEQRLEDQLREAQGLEQQTKQRLEDQLREAQKLEQEVKQHLEVEQRLEDQLQEAQGLEQQAKQHCEAEQRFEHQLQEVQGLEQQAKQRLEDQLREAQKLEQEVKQHLEVEQRLEDQLQEAQRMEQEAKQRLEDQLQESRRLEQEAKQHREAQQRLEQQLQKAQKLEQEAKQSPEAERRLQDQLREAQKLERQAKQHLQAEQRLQVEQLEAQKREMEAVQTLAGGIAHGFDGLLTTINGHTDILLDAVGDEQSLGNEGKEIKRVRNRAAQLTRQLAALGRQQMREQKDLDLNEIVRNMEQTLIRLVGENIEIHTALDPALRRIVGDTGSLQQVIMNLAANARDAMPDGGKLTIKTENRSLDEAGAGEFSEGRSGDFIRLSVTDSGVGISADVVKRITEPFFTTKPAGQGKGLGLSVVYGIAKQHDGWLAVESKAGQGATLDVYLPAVQKKVAEKPTPIETGGKTRGSGERVLIVAGNPSELMLATRALWKNGYRVTNVGSAERAMEYCARKEESLDLVFCDIRLPGKKKVQFVEELLRRRPNLAVLVCSDPNAGKAELSQLRDKGIPLLRKPYRAPELLRRVREALRSAQPERKSSSPGRREERSA